MVNSTAQLSVEAHARAVRYIKEHARPVERALYAFAFEDGSNDAVVTALTPYQREDGGFALIEADFTSDTSSVLATIYALRLLCEVGSGEEFAARAMRYIVESYDPHYKSWPIIPAHDNSAPHAPWWHYGAEFGKDWNFFLDNPRPEVLAYLYQCPSEVPTKLRESATREVASRLPQLEKLAINEYQCYLRLAATDSIPATLKVLLDQRLPELAHSSIETDSSKWHQYCTRPLDVIHSPRSILYADFQEQVEANLHFAIAQQGEDGSWTPNWNWGETYPEAWREAKKQWQGVLTLEHLQILRTFDCLPS
ncbi:MAG: hypothetical protein ACKVJG_22665 [Candidatus Latescibacterota bacterium]|jgi:hypothetical protein